MSIPGYDTWKFAQTDYKECSECPDEVFEGNLCLRHFHEAYPDVPMPTADRNEVARVIRCERQAARENKRIRFQYELAENYKRLSEARRNAQS